MIYTIAEYTATIIECIIILLFLVLSSRYKQTSKQKNIFKTIFFSVLIVTNALLWDNIAILFEHELLHICTYILLFYITSEAIFIGKWWRKLVIILIAILSVFLVNLVVTLCSGVILGDHYSQILLMRNPTRVFLLLLTKLGLAVILFIISNFIRNKNYSLQFMQCIITTVLLITSIISGVTIEKMLLDNVVSLKYASIIMICISIIVILLFSIIVQFSIKNNADIIKVALQTKLHDDEQRINELVQMNISVKSVKHDLRNHTTVLKKLLAEQNINQALNYIEKLDSDISDIQAISNTNNPALNAILDAKRVICKKENIDLKCYLQSELPDFDYFSLSTVLGNLMDNAIEAEKNEENKVIKLSITSDSNNIEITIQNRISESVLINDKLPKTTKKDSQNHGLGMISITETLTQNNGIIDIYELEGWFVTDVIMRC